MKILGAAALAILAIGALVVAASFVWLLVFSVVGFGLGPD
jgi:hypothetical protein